MPCYPPPCRVSSANGRPGGFCVSEKDCGDGSDEKTCPEPAGQCIETHAPSPQDPTSLSFPKPLGSLAQSCLDTRRQKQQGQEWKSQGQSGREGGVGVQFRGEEVLGDTEEADPGEETRSSQKGRSVLQEPGQLVSESCQCSGGRMFIQTPTSGSPSLSSRQSPGSQHPVPVSGRVQAQGVVR